MSEDLNITTSTDKTEQYQSLVPQIEALLYGERDLIANLANICAALKEQFKWFWIGFYLVKEDELVLGPFQGPVACTRIALGKGVCGSAWEQANTLIVPDVDAFPGHIPAAHFQNQKLLYRYLLMIRSWRYWMWIVKSWINLMKPMPITWKKL
jgi:L-methionine (R)-S-oxide reductase